MTMKDCRRVAACMAAAMLGATWVATPAASFAAPEFLAYEGRNAVHEGQGGEKKTVDGVDFWSNGDPPHRFMILGSLTDQRHASGLIGMVRMSSLDDDIAKAAKAAGGDAVILDGEGTEVVGMAGFGTSNAYATGGYGWGRATGFSSGVTRPIEKHDARYIVVKYLPDTDQQPVAAPLPPAQSAAPNNDPVRP
jgi:hypothetical protein